MALSAVQDSALTTNTWQQTRLNQSIVAYVRQHLWAPQKLNYALPFHRCSMHHIRCHNMKGSHACKTKLVLYLVKSLQGHCSCS